MKAQPVVFLQEGKFRCEWENLPLTAHPYDIPVPSALLGLTHLQATKHPDRSWHFTWLESVIGKYDFDVDGHHVELWIVQEPQARRIEARYNDQEVKGIASTLIPDDVASDFHSMHHRDIAEDEIEGMESRFRELYAQGHISV